MFLTPRQFGLPLTFELSNRRSSSQEEQEAYVAATSQERRLADVLLDKPLGTGVDVEGVGHIYWLGLMDSREFVLLCAPAISLEARKRYDGDPADFNCAMLATETEASAQELRQIEAAVAQALVAPRFVGFDFYRSQVAGPYGGSPASDPRPALTDTGAYTIAVSHEAAAGLFRELQVTGMTIHSADGGTVWAVEDACKKAGQRYAVLQATDGSGKVQAHAVRLLDVSIDEPRTDGLTITELRRWEPEGQPQRPQQRG